MIRQILEATTPGTPVEMGNAFLEVLEKLAGEGQVGLMGPFVFVGNKKGGILAQLELSFHTAGMFDQNPAVHVGFVGVKPEDRGKGYAARVLRMVSKAADELGWTITGDVLPQKMRGDKRPPMNRTRLSKFYKMFGANVDKTGHVKRKPTPREMVEKILEATVLDNEQDLPSIYVNWLIENIPFGDDEEPLFDILSHQDLFLKYQTDVRRDPHEIDDDERETVTIGDIWDHLEESTRTFLTALWKRHCEEQRDPLTKRRNRRKRQ